MNPARLFRPLHFNDQLFKNASSTGYVLANQPQPLGLVHPPLPAHQAHVVEQQPAGSGPRWPVGNRAANSDFGVLDALPEPAKKFGQG